jgi:hypothetical protein
MRNERYCPNAVEARHTTAEQGQSMVNLKCSHKGAGEATRRADNLETWITLNLKQKTEQ